MKHCNLCSTSKSEDEFGKAKKGKNGKDWYCRDCRSVCARKTREKRKQGIPLNQAGKLARIKPKNTRWCSGICKSLLPISEFTGIEIVCKKCKYIAHIRRKYGLSLDEYTLMTIKQNGKCAICKVKPFKYVDHNHKSGKVRGLLCPACNSAIGFLKEDPNLFASALEYIRQEK